MRQEFPRVVLNSQDSFEGFLDGYVEGDGFRNKKIAGRTVISGNISLLAGTCSVSRGAFHAHRSHGLEIVYSGQWERKHGFRKEDHRTDLCESQWVKVQNIESLRG